MPPRIRGRSRASDSPEVSRSPRSTRARRTVEADTSIGEEHNDDNEEDYEDNNDDDVEDDEPIVPKSRKRKTEESDGDDDEDEGEEEDDGEDEDEGEEADGEEEAAQVKSEDDNQPAVEVAPAPERKIPKKRGRKKTKLTPVGEGFLDEDGNPISIIDDEVVIENEDPKGLEKIDANGVLQGGRKFRMKTFTLLGKGEKQYMVSTEPARLVGFRDSYLLFKTHRSLFKKVCTHEEKMDLIDRHLIPNSYKGRTVNLVAARSIFREFGAKLIHEGKKVIDDFWEQRAIDNGDVPGEYADPAESFKAQFKAGLLGDSSMAGGGSPLAATALLDYQTDVSWMYQIAVQTKEYNSALIEQRNQSWVRGVKDVYSGLNFFPVTSQPTKSLLTRVGPSNSLVYDINFANPNLRRKVTGLALVPKEIVDDIEDEEIKKAVLEQQQFEKSV